MSRDFSPEKGFPNPFAFGDIRFSPQNLRQFHPRAGLTKIYTRDVDTNQSATLPYRPYPLRETLPEMLQQLHSLKPLTCSGNQRELARKALTALKNCTQEDIINLAKSVAEDVASAID